jgi:superfamily II DNA or RNA helicase
MPTIFDNVRFKLADELRGVIEGADGADFCVGYFNLRGWGQLADLVDDFAGNDASCSRVLVGMYRPPEAEMREAYSAVREDRPLDPPTRKQLLREAGEGFKRQIEFGVPTDDAEAALRRLAAQLRAGKVRVKLFLPHPIHAKLYMIHRPELKTPLIGYVGSSNLTLSGLTKSGELNVDVVEQDAAEKLHDWFHEHWDHKYAIDISDELAELIETSWATEELIRPYLVYLKIISHISAEARLGEQEFKLPKDLEGLLLDFQTKAVSLAAQHLHRRNGVLLGDVVGLGKTFMAVAVARIIQDDEVGDTLIICPPKLQEMWESYVERYRLIARVMSLGKVQDDLPELKRYKLVIIDESHNLRNRDAARYQVIRDYIERNDPRCMLLTATPYNKHYTDMSNQLRLFLDERADLGVRPERYFQDADEGQFVSDYQASTRSLVAFEQSEYPVDWRDLMRHFMVRRTRDYIIENYAKYDHERERHFVLFPNGDRSYFPKRIPHNLTFRRDESNPDDQYARLYRQEIVDSINDLKLPRYGLALYLDEECCTEATDAQQEIIDDLGRAGPRLMGFCRTNLFKRLESSGYSFLLSLSRHVLRNMVTHHAVVNGLPVPIGTQDAGLLDTAISDSDTVTEDSDGEEGVEEAAAATPGQCGDFAWFEKRAAEIYERYRDEFQSRFRWLPADFFTEELTENLAEDARALCDILRDAGEWDPDGDTKLDALERLTTEHHGSDKVIIFTQFADTASYLAKELEHRNVVNVAAVTGQSGNPTRLSRLFSPQSNDYTLKTDEEQLRVLVATDILSEGQNLQDCHVVVNYDLPWAIIRLIQRAGRVDRIGQKEDTIHVYSFKPADGVEHIIRLHSRLTHRLKENNEVVGSDEQFFGEEYENKLRDLYTERAEVLDEDDGEDVDLVSQAQEIWEKASEEDRQAAVDLPKMVFATRTHDASEHSPGGAIVYMRTGDVYDALVRVNEDGEVISQSLSSILEEAACDPDTPGVERDERHHEWVAGAVKEAHGEQSLSGGRLGPPRSTRRKIYERMQAYHQATRQSLQTVLTPEMFEQSIDAIMRFNLTSRANETLGRQLRLGASDETLAEIVTTLYEEEKLVVVEDEPTEVPEPDVICSIGLKIEQGDAANGD